MSGPFGSTPHNLFNTTSTSFYNGVIEQSLRFDNARNTYLNKTYGTAQTNTKKITASFWFKPSKISTDRMSFLYARNGGAGEIKLNNHKIYANLFDTGYDGFFNNSLIRDPQAWYHLVYQGDSTLADQTARNKVYLNGVQLTNNASSYTQLNTDTNYLKNGQVSNIGRDVDNAARDIDGYMAELHVIDGSVVAHTEFGEFKEGIWIAKSYSGSYGNNGFYMTFANTGTATTSDGTTATTNIGDDQSGNGRNFASNGFASGDVVPDSPESNFPVMNVINDAGSAQSVFAFTEGNLKVRNTASNYSQAIATQSVRTGKWYYECYINEAGYPSWQIGWMVGGQNGLGENEMPSFDGSSNSEQASFTGLGYFTSSDVYISDWGEGQISTQQIAYSGLHSAGDAPTTGDIIGVAADFDNRKFWWHINGEYINVGSGTGNPATGANASSTYTASEAPDDAEKYPWLTAYGSSSFVFNFGQDGTFAGNKTAQGNSDENGIGDFFYSVPTGFLAFTSKNFSDTEISPNTTNLPSDNYNTVLYTGEADDDVTVTNTFAAEWVWLKCRNNSDHHFVQDVVRGFGASKSLSPSSTGEEGNNGGAPSSMNIVTTNTSIQFLGDDFTKDSRPFVAWTWKAGGTPTASNSASAGAVPTSGSVMIDGVASTSTLAGSIAATKISANTKTGLSIGTFTKGSGTQTVAHGLNEPLDWYVVKRTNGSGSWFVYHRAMASDAETDYVRFNSANAISDDATVWGDTAPTDEVFSVSTAFNASEELVFYAGHNVEGFSKFGTFAGNSSADGTFVYCGFKPARIWLKRYDGSTVDWTTYDLLREGYNVDNDTQRFVAAVEQADDDLDILSNGFKMRRNMANNQGDVIFFAWADSPVKYSNAR